MNKCRFGYWIYDKWHCIVKGRTLCDGKFESCKDAVIDINNTEEGEK